MKREERERLVEDGMLGLTWLFGWRWDGEAEVSAVFTVQPAFVLLPPPSHPVQTHPCGGKTPVFNIWGWFDIYATSFWLHS